MKPVERYCPDRGDIVSMDFAPTKGHEADGRRPAVVLSLSKYNIKTRLCVVAPITRTVRGCPFESQVPAGLPVSGVALSDQVSLRSWHDREARLICPAPADFADDVARKFKALLP